MILSSELQLNKGDTVHASFDGKFANNDSRYVYFEGRLIRQIN